MACISILRVVTLSTDLKASVVSGVKWLAFSKVLIQLFRWVSTFWVIRLLNAHDYGVMAIVEIMAALLVSVNYLCIGNAIIRFKTLSKPVLDTLFTCCLLIGLFLFSVQFLSADYFSQFYKTPEAKLVLQVIAIAYLIECFNVKPMAIMSKNMQFKQLAKIDIIAGLAMPIAVLVCAYVGLGYWALAIGHLVNAIIKTLIANLMFKTQYKFGFRFKRSLPLLKFGAKNALTSVIAQINTSLDFIIGGYYFTASQLGFYQVGLQVSFVPLRKISPELRRISFPAFSKIKNNKEKVISSYLKSIRLISFIVFPIFWGIGAISSPLTNIILGEQWSESADVILIICMFLPIKLLTEMTNSMLNALGQASALLINSFLSLVIFAISIYFLLDFGILGLSYSWGVNIIFTYLITINKASKILKISKVQIIGTFSRSLIGCTLMFLSVNYLNRVVTTDGVLLAIGIMIGSFIYCVYSVIFQKNIIFELKGMKRKKENK
jgi:teichuronic acid exporter